MNKNTFIEITGDTPESLVGDEWETVDLDQWCDDAEYTHEGHLMGGCSYCKLD